MNDERNERFDDFADDVKDKAVRRAKGKAKRKVKSKAKRISFASYIIWVLALVGGIAAGFGVCSFLCRNDGFELKGKSEYTLPLGDEGSSVTYADKGVEIISFGRDISDEVNISTNLVEDGDGEYIIDTSKEGVYYIVYTVDDVRFGEIRRVRTFRVGGEG